MNTLYFYLDKNNQQAGPIAPQQFTAFGLTVNSFVWCEGMSNWQRISELPELMPFVTVPGAGEGTYPRYQYAPNANYRGNYATPGPPPANYMVWAILTTILCCLPFGIVSIVYSSKVESLWAQGRCDEALSNARSAKNWALAAGICGFIGGGAYAGLILFGVFSNL